MKRPPSNPHRLLLPLLLLLQLAAACSGNGRAEPEPQDISPLPTPRLLIVGIDGATFDRIHPLASQGRLPNLSALMERGAWGALETLEPTVSPAIWTTVATGRLPEVHGILGFEGVPGHDMTTLPTSQMRRVRAFWNILSEHERSTGVVSWWVTWPAEPIDGYVVSDRAAYTRMEAAIGRDAIGPHEVHPAEIAAEVRRRIRLPNEVTLEELRSFAALTEAEFEQRVRNPAYRHGDFLPELKFVYQADRSTLDIALHLIEERPTAVTAVAFYGVDVTSHLAWHFSEPERFPDLAIPAEEVAKFGGVIDRYYEFVDAMLGRLVEAVGPETNILVFSDHGFGGTGPERVMPWSGGHGKLTPGAPIAPDGILILAGPSIRGGVRLDRPHVLDLAPTVLHLQGLPLAADMPGGVHTEALREEFIEAVPLRQLPTYEVGPRRRPEGAPATAPELDADTIERLKALGYLD